MKKTYVRVAVYFSAWMLLILITGVWGWISSMNQMMGTDHQPLNSSLVPVEVEPPPYNPNKPTVAVLLGSDSTEVIDFLAPYELFSATKHFNVFAVAPDRRITTLTGGLDVIPHYSFEELDELLGNSPDVVVIPAIFYMDHQGYEAVDDYIKKHSNNDTMILTICTGAENLAHTGLLDGKTATTHWGDMGRLEKKYPEVKWIHDQRFVAAGNIVSSAGLTSGIDATLYAISQLAGEPIAERTARSIHYPNFHYVKDPSMERYHFDLRDAVFILNHAFVWKKQNEGVLLYDGMQETALASVFDTFSAMGTSKTFTISKTISPVKTKHGLYLIPRYQNKNAPNIDRLIVTGTNPSMDLAKYIKEWRVKDKDTEMVYMHAMEPGRFVLEAPIEDLARQTNIPTAVFAAKRLEYRADALQLEGDSYPTGVIVLPVMMGFLSLVMVIWMDRRFLKKENRRAKKSIT
ncbi:DJ-1/PfpI family protein [Desmospora profundinema]|uniref:Transcriptional regulator GlxA family with amidase domain n=1 Tax=Desmospora profundinema TaxID=1571184 RepID=A0ABU1IIN4_9BACL|nr:DJ-1/PfpI family protein [Desmospora profundinema]MDR6224621.1 transcriptional regulator GlxA family with amidase domain [Desmospora profundinema]